MNWNWENFFIWIVFPIVIWGVTLWGLWQAFKPYF